MGWLWPFSSGDASNQSQTEPSQPAPATSSMALTEEQRMRIFGKPGLPASSPQTREQEADSELDALIKSFQEEGNSSKSQSSSSSAPATADSEPSTPSRTLPDGSLDISPEAIYPRTMSCRQQFDQAFYCQSLGGKFNDIYRFGHLKSCSEQWGAFWFCMRTRTLPQKEKEERIVEYYRDRDEKKKQEFGSSEDIWDIRRVGLNSAFNEDPDKDDDVNMVRE